MLIYTAKRGSEVLGRWTSATDLNQDYRDPAWGDPEGITVEIRDTDTEPAVIAEKQKAARLRALRAQIRALKASDINTIQRVAQVMADLIEALDLKD